MRVVLFGAGNKGTAILNKLIELKQEVVGVFYLEEDEHEVIWYEKIKDVASRYNIPYSFGIPIIINQTLRDWNPDVIFVVGWRYKITKEQYSIPPKGTIVFHDSLLPKYRGFAPMNWAIINGETKTGATMFYIADEIDNGDIIAQKSINITEEDDVKTLDGKITQLYLMLLEGNLFRVESINILTGRIGKPQNHSEATYCCKRIPEDGLIDWNKSAAKIHNLIRGLTYPYPCAYSYLNGQKIMILKSTLVDCNKNYVGYICGRVTEIMKGKGVKVLTGDGEIIIEKIMWDNKIVVTDEVVKSIKATFRSN
jgi:methionyl-tRNA formyltransferase